MAGAGTVGQGFFNIGSNFRPEKQDDEVLLLSSNIRLDHHEMTVKIRKWMTRSEGGEPSNYLICAGEPGDLLSSLSLRSLSVVEEGETSSIAAGCNELHHASLRDACIERTLRMLISKNSSVNDNGRRLMEELSEDFQKQLVRRRERPLPPATENEILHLPLWVSIALSVSVPFLITMVVRELIRIKNLDLEALAYDEFQRQYEP